MTSAIDTREASAASEASPLGTSLLLVVTDVRLAAEGVVTITFVDPDGEQLPAWEPGAHLEILLPSGLRRQYSLCGSASDRHRYQVAVLKETEGRGGSVEIHDTGLVGKILPVDGPRNHFALAPSRRYLFIAGGIGITPIFAMIQALPEGADWELHYGGRTARSMAFVEELRSISSDRVHVVPQDAEGLLPIDAIVAAADADTAIYCCGPGPLLDAVQDARARLAPAAAFHFERFAASATRPAAADLGDDQTVEVVLARTGVTLEAGPERSLLDAIRDVVPAVPFSCTEGYCGSCEARVLEGTPDHRDEILTEAERAAGDTMFPCVSRALTRRLVLDI
ncbi:ferredoxin [Acrocarpospora pleiomorpha]|uniref:Ferredoxin n=1 Tax=Acrocarpospora pleiomorpha TaxID=90975 RepID=A0A5M3XHC7_9ACTN|nr:PDR/VanB family oxidoreductase [Acrocarpospora pleiomorpha]GES17498.1 ferredoxin [Acrocarpospora pleiomorpha]